MHALAGERLPITIQNVRPGAPITVGVPFPKGALHSPDHVRVLNAAGSEIPAQVTEVSTWEPADPSIKWIWVFFFAEDNPNYLLEYGEEIRRAPIEDNRVMIRNSQREHGSVQIDTGPLRLTIRQRGSGFFDSVELDLEGDGFQSGDQIALGNGERGSFLDLVDGETLHASRAVITQTHVEAGSGPLHGIVRVEGEYRYDDESKNPAPFVLRIHAYAGQSFVRVLRTITYTGVPDRSAPVEGEHAQIATQGDRIIDEEARLQDPGLRQPKDRIAATGLSLKYLLDGDRSVRTGYSSGEWWRESEQQIVRERLGLDDSFSIVQLGPRLDESVPERTDVPWFFVMPPIPRSTANERLSGAFAARVERNGAPAISAEKAEGWLDISDDRRGVSIGIRHFLEEYPTELAVHSADSVITAYFWSPGDAPMSFARWSSRMDAGMAGNFAQGLAKTSEAVFFFRSGSVSEDDIRRTTAYVLDPSVAHVEPAWYAQTEVFGQFAPASDKFPELERGLDYKFRWMLFNQKWEPWYGMFSHGDWLTYYFDNRWIQWNLNEPAVDFMWWLQFMRTGNRDFFLAAEASSRHSMDVGNIHWPAETEYLGDTNPAVDYWKTIPAREGSPYVGMGRRHANQQWAALLTAHVWVQGWLAAYYLTGYHRALDVAEQTGRMYLRRSWGEHGLTGRRLYLSVLNLAELYDATKDPVYFDELKDRIERMLYWQRRQGGSLVMDRYGYAQVYATHGLWKYRQITGDENVREALIRNARRVRDVPPLDHELESYLSSIHGLVVGYQLTGDEDFLSRALHRARHVETAALEEDFVSYTTQRKLAEALESASRMPPHPDFQWTNWELTSGLRVFGWTHAFTVPYLMYWLEAWR